MIIGAAKAGTTSLFGWLCEHPFIELRDPATIVKPWRPGSGIVARQAATMAQIGAGLSRPRDTE